MLSEEDIKIAEEYFDNLSYKFQKKFLDYIHSVSHCRDLGQQEPKNFEFARTIFVEFPPRIELINHMLKKLNKKGKRTLWSELE